MSNIRYDVELLRQENNPICWVASCAMVKGYGVQTCVGIGDLTGGFDPYNSCIANLASSWTDCTDKMAGWGFDVYNVSDLSSGTMTADDLAKALGAGPAVLLHLCNGFPYGSQWTPLTSGAHAVVITGIDSDNNKATFNNPWGDQDQACALDVLIAKINADKSVGKTLGFWHVTQTTASTPGDSADTGSSSDSSNSAESSSSTESSGSSGGEQSSSSGDGNDAEQGSEEPAETTAETASS